MQTATEQLELVVRKAFHTFNWPKAILNPLLGKEDREENRGAEL